MLTQRPLRAERFVKDNSDDLRSAHGDRGVKFGFAHVKAAKGGKDCERQF